MKNILKSLGVVLVATLILFPAFGSKAMACDSCKLHNDGSNQSKPGQMHAGHEHHQAMALGKVDSKGRARGATMGLIYKADELYTCPMHKEIITDNSEAKCPLCNMNLAKMTQEETDSLKTSLPKGCPMDPIVVKGDSKTTKCDICNMNLIDIKQKDEAHTGHGHSH